MLGEGRGMHKGMQWFDLGVPDLDTVTFQTTVTSDQRVRINHIDRGKTRILTKIDSQNTI